KSPVTLYTTKNCAPCDAGRTLLITRGIPHTERTVNSNEDITVLKKIGGDTQLPLLMIGTQKQQGFESETWNSALTAANYPTTSKLPPTYLPAPIVAAAPPKAEVAAKAVPEQTVRKSNSRNTTTPAGNSPTAPAGFQF
ncbi:MAG: glutaredoxin family protein, partial [Herbaspirillum sp.]